MSIRKQYLKSKPLCKVTLSLPASVAGSTKNAYVVGEFNNWDHKAMPMKPLKDGSFKTTLDLARDKSYQFRYLMDDNTWENDPEADDYIVNGLTGDKNSVINI